MTYVPLSRVTNDLGGRLRRDEYTGSNRCWACTAVNVALSALVAVVLIPLSGVAAVVALTGALATVYFRGYLVPGTPELTKRYLPSRLLAWFGKQPLTVSREESTDAWLLSQGLLRESSDGDFALDPEFKASLAAVDPPQSPSASLARDILELPPTDGSFTSQQGRYTLSDDGDPIAAWPSSLALDADLRAKAVLSERYTGWNERPPDEIAALLRSVRATVDRCLRCDEPTEYEQVTHETCCASVTVERLTCPQCDEPLVELRR